VVVFADLRHALRVISRTPSFAVTVVGVLALGIGATTAIFSVVNAVLLRPLPFEEPERLVRIYTRTPGPDGRLFDVRGEELRRDLADHGAQITMNYCGFLYRL